MGEKLEDCRAAQPGALHGQTHLPPGHEPLWRHGEPAVCTHTHARTRMVKLIKALLNLWKDE